ncbi:MULTISPECIES: ABC transporter ATP-binding protein [Aerococcus]|uniref:ATP-binding cassette domain-containing protein n=1 Tax=Aerococcus TaxID=1375 RepID=UPI00143968E5|nr:MULTISPECIES: ABC transporter ATP-binding protein [Aerococcus]MDK6369275.1 ABC transporter ATP-binding protein [Aerococcus sp. UMB9870]MDK6679099.1 ABC transporter ATP-binding protein [Aerococcus sp. UMB8608]MDK6687006.1 ABC transporter ATP-binding protein [Aerococcus sp. UMB8623]
MLEEEIQQDANEVKHLKDNIKVRDLNFSYDLNVRCLKEINLEIPYGQKVALLGESGSGKSTLAKILVGFYNTDEGNIYFGDKPITTLGLSHLRHHISYVPQDAFVISGTIYDNLIYGIDREVSNQELMDVLEEVCLIDYINTSPQGLQTFIEEAGANLSGGQKQRLALARALLRRSDIYILDEATSALDPKSEITILNHLLKHEETYLFIGHHLPIVDQCDQLIEMSKGKIVVNH